MLRFRKERLAILARRIPAAGRRPRRYRRRPAAGYLLAGPIVEAVEWPRLQLLHSTPPRPDANRLAHETIHEQTRQGSTGRDRETGKLLLRHTTADSRLRGEKDPQRLRAWYPACREASSLLPTRQLVTEDEPHPPVEVGTVAAECEPWSALPPELASFAMAQSLPEVVQPDERRDIRARHIRFAEQRPGRAAPGQLDAGPGLVDQVGHAHGVQDAGGVGGLG